MSGATRRRQPGQILPFFAVALTAIIALAALLFDGAHALVFRRQLQDAGDAAALAAANLIQTEGPNAGCSATAGPPPGAPRAALVAAARNSVAANLPGHDVSTVAVSCPSGWNNTVVRVQLTETAPTFFARVITSDVFDVNTVSAAINGSVRQKAHSIVLLNPSNLSWPNGRDGCPSFLLSGGPTVVIEGDVQVNSACRESDGGAFATNGTASSVTLNSDATVRVVGEYRPAGPLNITPAPVNLQPSASDPLKDLPAVPVATLPVVRTSALVQNGGVVVLTPGRYQGGIELKSDAKAFFLPGVYVMEGGGLRVGGQSSVYSIPVGLTTTATGTWSTDCPEATCGVLIYNTSRTGSGPSAAMGPIDINAGAKVMLRAYQPAADLLFGGVAPFDQYRNLLLFQDRAPVPSNSYAQPTISLGGGGIVDLSGTLYAPSAAVLMKGAPSGSGGDLAVRLQFVSWDLHLRGNTRFTFLYQAGFYAKLTDYGLVE
ncbi:MAG: hypothetical protein H0X16_07660 [Chloroflexi bacterium]|nr:hypothetical protein [Chloroflexota bacterium]